jgi:ABC-type phosphate/phosphonate transport system substrate-binding protein
VVGETTRDLHHSNPDLAKVNAGRSARLMHPILILCALAFTALARPVAAQQNSAPSIVFRLGFAPSVFAGTDSRDANAAIEIWAREVLKSEGTKNSIKSTIFERLEDLVAAIKAKSIDLAVFSTPDFLQVRNECTVEPAAVAAKSGAYGDEGILIVHSTSGINSAAELKGKTLATVDNSHGTILKLWFNRLWGEAGKTKPRPEYPKSKTMTKEEQIVYSVFFKQTDAGLVTATCLKTMIELNPQIARDIKTIHTSPTYLFGLMCWASPLKSTDRNEFQAQILKMDKNPRGQQILKLFQTDRMLEFKPEYLTTIENLYKSTKTAVPSRYKR